MGTQEDEELHKQKSNEGGKRFMRKHTVTPYTVISEGLVIAFSKNLKEIYNIVHNQLDYPAFVIRSPAPYLISFFGAKTDCN